MTAPTTRIWRRLERRVTGRFTVQVRAPILQVLKGAAAAILAWFLCLLVFPEQLPIFGAIAALIVIQDNVDLSLTRGVERVVGVLLGISIALGAGALFGAHSWLFVAAIVVSMLVGWLLRMTSTSSNQIAISALLMIALGGLQVDYGIERLIETAIGAFVGVALNALVVAPVHTSPVRDALTDLAVHAARALERLADALAAPRDDEWLDSMLEEARKLQTERAEVHALLRQARDSLRLNPRSGRYRFSLAEDDALFQRLQPIVTQVIGMSRALYDLYDPELTDDQSVIGMVEEMRRAAHDLELLAPREGGSSGEGPDAGEDGSAGEPLALTAPYTIPRPHPVHWVLIGSLMEDLRRIRGRITGELNP